MLCLAGESGEVLRLNAQVGHMGATHRLAHIHLPMGRD